MVTGSISEVPATRFELPVRLLGATALVGLVLGFLIGGVGSRIAMRVLFLTSDPSVKGVESDDGFLIGQFTMDTANLLITGALFGLVGSFTYLGVRPWLLGPSWFRAVSCGAAAGAVIGSVVINPGGVDFTELSPVPLAVAMFVAIPALFAALCPLVIEWALRPESWVWRGPLWLVAAPLVVFLFPPILILIGLPIALVLVARYLSARTQRRAPSWLHLWGGRLGWGAVAALGFVLLAEDLLALR